jgi:HSP20 family protein
MPGLIVWKDQHISRLKKDIDRMFDRMFGEFGLPAAPRIMRGAPFIDMSETKDDLILKAEIPGVNPEDLEIVIANNTITISGDTKQEIVREGDKYHRTERRYGSFSRTVQLPCRVEIDKVKATYESGVLKIVMPKCAPETTRVLKLKPR